MPEQQQVSTRCEQLAHLLTALETHQPLQNWTPFLFNRLQEYVLPFYPAVVQAVSDLKNTAAKAVLMSGSGSTVFALAENDEHAKQIAAQIRRPDRQVFCTSFFR